MLTLISEIICTKPLSIHLDRGESYTYNSMISDPTIYDITSKENIDVAFDEGSYTYRCINVTFCTKQYGKCEAENINVILITITSNEDNNVIVAGTRESKCSSTDNVWTQLTIVLSLSLFICCCLMTFCYYKRLKLLHSNSEMMPLLDM